MTQLASWARADFSDGSRTFPVYRRGTGPGVVVVHEIPGITPPVVAFGDEVAALASLWSCRACSERPAPRAPL